MASGTAGDPVGAALERAGGALRAGRAADAQRMLEAEGVREDPRAQNLLGLCYFKAGRLDAAREIYERLLQRFPREASLLVNLGLVQLRLADLAAAERSFRAALTAAPGHRRAHGYLGLVLYRRGRLEEARGHFEAGNARDFAQRNTKQGPAVRQVSAEAETALAAVEQPFRSVDLEEAPPSGRDDRGWQATTWHRQPVPVPEAADEASRAPRGGPPALDAPLRFPTMTASHEVRAVLEAAAAMAPDPPELLFSLDGTGRSRLSLDDVDALEAGQGRPGFVAGPGGRAKLTLSGAGAIAEGTLVVGLGRRVFERMTRPSGWLAVTGPSVLLLSVEGLAVALRELRDAVFAPGVLRGYAGNWTVRVARGDSISLSGAGSALITSGGAPLVLPIARGREVVCARRALLAWAQTTTVAPVEDDGDHYTAKGPGWVVVSERC